MRIAISMLMAILAVGMLRGQNMSGDWHGTLEIGGMKLRLVFHITEADGTFAATMDSPDQGARGIPVETVTVDGSDLTISMPRLGVTYKGQLAEDGSKIEGTFQQGVVNAPLELGREATALNRPQEPSPPYPYREETVSYENPQAEGVTLAGTLTLPEGDGPFPAVILISGSGPQNRDEELLGHKPFWVIADHFTRAGIAVLRFDDRGVGASTGSHGTATSADFAGDVQAGIDFLQSRSEIDPAKIGLAGHSEGGLIGPMVAADNPEVAFLILMAGPGVRGDNILLLQQELLARAEGATEEQIRTTRRINEKMFEELQDTKDLEASRKKLVEEVRRELEGLPPAVKAQMGDLDQLAQQQVAAMTSPWFLHFLTYDPAPVLQRVSCPVLAVNGEKDLQVNAEQNLPVIAEALRKGGNEQVTTRVLPGLNHLFQHSETGRMSEYAQLEETFAPEVLELMTQWIKEQL